MVVLPQESELVPAMYVSKIAHLMFCLAVSIATFIWRRCDVLKMATRSAAYNVAR